MPVAHVTTFRLRTSVPKRGVETSPARCLFPVIALSPVAVAIFIAMAIMRLTRLEFGQDAADNPGVRAGKAGKRGLDETRSDTVGFNRIDNAFNTASDKRRIRQAHHRRRIDHDVIIAFKQPHYEER